MNIFFRKSLKEKYDESLRTSIQAVHKNWKDYEQLKEFAVTEDETLNVQAKLEEKKYRLLLRVIRRREL
jgi:hypothetical protein